MATVTYKHQPAIHATRGTVPLEGTDKRPYTVSKILWPEQIIDWLRERLIGTSLHVCAGMVPLGDCKLDMYAANADVVADAARLPFPAQSWDTVLIDLPYNGKFQWNHDMLSELGRVARRRILFQHWFMPVDKSGRFKKDHRFTLSEVAIWQPQTYFGRVQVISVLDA